MMKRNWEFTHYEFPVDVFWSDILFAQDFEYFVFNKYTWPLNKVEELNAEIALSKRRLVLINNPHVKASEDYFVYQKGMAIQNATQTPENYANIFIRDPTAT
jgi:alpha-glucosidase (family GH31 glycosyl hydrolase)